MRIGHFIPVQFFAINNFVLVLNNLVFILNPLDLTKYYLNLNDKKQFHEPD
jgi:hypothetical protein